MKIAKKALALVLALALVVLAMPMAIFTASAEDTPVMPSMTDHKDLVKVMTSDNGTWSTAFKSGTVTVQTGSTDQFYFTIPDAYAPGAESVMCGTVKMNFSSDFESSASSGVGPIIYTEDGSWKNGGALFRADTLFNLNTYGAGHDASYGFKPATGEFECVITFRYDCATKALQVWADKGTGAALIFNVEATYASGFKFGFRQTGITAGTVTYSDYHVWDESVIDYSANFDWVTVPDTSAMSDKTGTLAATSGALANGGSLSLSGIKAPSEGNEVIWQATYSYDKDYVNGSENNMRFIIGTYNRTKSSYGEGGGQSVMVTNRINGKFWHGVVDGYANNVGTVDGKLAGGNFVNNLADGTDGTALSNSTEVTMLFRYVVYKGNKFLGVWVTYGGATHPYGNYDLTNVPDFTFAPSIQAASMGAACDADHPITISNIKYYSSEFSYNKAAFENGTKFTGSPVALWRNGGDDGYSKLVNYDLTDAAPYTVSATFTDMHPQDECRPAIVLGSYSKKYDGGYWGEKEIRFEARMGNNSADLYIMVGNGQPLKSTLTANHNYWTTEYTLGVTVNADGTYTFLYNGTPIWENVDLAAEMEASAHFGGSGALRPALGMYCYYTEAHSHCTPTLKYFEITAAKAIKELDVLDQNYDNFYLTNLGKYFNGTSQPDLVHPNPNSLKYDLIENMDLTKAHAFELTAKINGLSNGTYDPNTMSVRPSLVLAQFDKPGHGRQYLRAEFEIFNGGCDFYVFDQDRTVYASGGRQFSYWNGDVEMKLVKHGDGTYSVIGISGGKTVTELDHIDLEAFIKATTSDAANITPVFGVAYGHADKANIPTYPKLIALNVKTDTPLTLKEFYDYQYTNFTFGNGLVYNPNGTVLDYKGGTAVDRALINNIDLTNDTDFEIKVDFFDLYGGPVDPNGQGSKPGFLLAKFDRAGHGTQYLRAEFEIFNGANNFYLFDNDRTVYAAQGNVFNAYWATTLSAQLINKNGLITVIGKQGSNTLTMLDAVDLQAIVEAKYPGEISNFVPCYGITYGMANNANINTPLKMKNLVVNSNTEHTDLCDLDLLENALVNEPDNTTNASLKTLDVADTVDENAFFKYSFDWDIRAYAGTSNAMQNNWADLGTINGVPFGINIRTIQIGGPYGAYFTLCSQHGDAGIHATANLDKSSYSTDDEGNYWYNYHVEFLYNAGNISVSVKDLNKNATASLNGDLATGYGITDPIESFVIAPAFQGQAHKVTNFVLKGNGFTHNTTLVKTDLTKAFIPGPHPTELINVTDATDAATYRFEGDGSVLISNVDFAAADAYNASGTITADLAGVAFSSAQFNPRVILGTFTYTDTDGNPIMNADGTAPEIKSLSYIIRGYWYQAFAANDSDEIIYQTDGTIDPRSFETEHAIGVWDVTNYKYDVTYADGKITLVVNGKELMTEFDTSELLDFKPAFGVGVRWSAAAKEAGASVTVSGLEVSFEETAPLTIIDAAKLDNGSVYVTRILSADEMLIAPVAKAEYNYKIGSLTNGDADVALYKRGSGFCYITDRAAEPEFDALFQSDEEYTVSTAVLGANVHQKTLDGEQEPIDGIRFLSRISLPTFADMPGYDAETFNPQTDIVNNLEVTADSFPDTIADFGVIVARAEDLDDAELDMDNAKYVRSGVTGYIYGYGADYVDVTVAIYGHGAEFADREYVVRSYIVMDDDTVILGDAMTQSANAIAE